MRKIIRFSFALMLSTICISQETETSYLEKKIQIEKLLLLNIGLDAAYVTSGFLLKEMSKKQPRQLSSLSGFWKFTTSTRWLPICFLTLFSL